MANILLNDTELYETANQAVEAVDTILSEKPAITGLEIAKLLSGFTYIDEDGIQVSGLRRVATEDSGFHYSLMTFPDAASRMSRADFRRDGYQLYLLELQRGPLPECEAVTRVISLGEKAIQAATSE